MPVISSAGAVIGAAVGYALAGIGLAIVEFLAFALAGFLAFRFGPVLRPPPPETIPRPPVGASPDAVRRRRNERIAMLAWTLPLAVLTAVLVIAAEATAVKLAAAAVAALLLVLAGLSVWMSGSSELWDRRRLRMYERAVENARRERALYDELEIDSARERERAMKAGRAVAVLLVAPMAGLLAIAPGLIAERSESAAVRTLGTAISVTLLAVLVGAVVAARRRTRR